MTVTRSRSTKTPADMVPKSDSTVVVVVGGQEFQESVHFLRSISDYFDGAIRSGRTESKEMRFEFPDKDPLEWELVKLLCSPFPAKRLDEKNWKAALSWFDHLSIPAGLEACEQFFLTFMNSAELSWVKVREFPYMTKYGKQTPNYVETIGRLLAYGQGSLECQLAHSKAKSMELISTIVERLPTILVPEHWVAIWCLLGEHEDFRLKLWDVVQKKLPLYASDKPQHELLQNDLLPRLVFLEVQVNEKLGALREIKKNTCGIDRAREYLKIPGVDGSEENCKLYNASTYV